MVQESNKPLHCHFTCEPAPGGSDHPHQPEEDHRGRAELAPEVNLPGCGQRHGGGPLLASSGIIETYSFVWAFFGNVLKTFLWIPFRQKMEQLPVRRQPMSLTSQTGLVILEKLHESGSKYFTLIWLLRRNTDTLIFHKFLITWSALRTKNHRYFLYFSF